MSNLYVVRHGQASFFAEDYDQLSATGETQSRLLGEYWVERGVTFDAVVCGPCRRHLDTARLVGQAYTERGVHWPAPAVLPGLDEYQAEAVLKLALPILKERRADVRELFQAVDRAADKAEKLRTFQKAYEAVIDLWAHGQLDLPQVESWDEFCRRAHAAYDQIVSASGGRRQIVAFTSGGPVGVAMQRSLGTDHRKTLQLAWMVRNASFSEFLFSGDRFTLSRYNAYPHLDQADHLTYR